MKKDIIKNKIKKMKCFEGYFLHRKYKKDKIFKKLVDSYSKNNTILFENQNGNMNEPIEILYIEVNDKNCGFFACWIRTLIELSYADRFEFKPVVNWTNNNPYFEEEGINGIYNPFEYYFNPVSEIKLEDVEKSKHIYNLLNIFKFNEKKYSYLYDEEQLVKINKKYITLKDNVKKIIENDIKKTIGNKKTLAVHVRGVEWGNVLGHPVPLNLKEYEEKIDEAIKTKKFEQIFLATDSDDTIDYFLEKYKGKVVFYKDVARANRGSKTLALFDKNIVRKQNHYLLGLEVLRDMLSLSYCDGFIAGQSNISSAVNITKKSNNEKFEYEYIFNQKINNTGISSKDAVNLMKEGKWK